MSFFGKRKSLIFLTALGISGVFLFSRINVKNALALHDAASYAKPINGTLTSENWNDLFKDFVNTWTTATMAGPLGIGVSTAPAAGLNVNGPIQGSSLFSLGSVGIGIASPISSRVQLYGNNTFDTALRFTNTGTNGGDYFILSSNSGWDAGGNKLLIGQGVPSSVNTKLVLTSDGNFGIATTSPAAKLGIASSTSRVINVGGGRIGGLDFTPINDDEAVSLNYLRSNYIPVGSTPGGIGAGTVGQTLRHNGTSWIASSLLYNNGTNIGIGTTNPQEKLHILGGVVDANQPSSITNSVNDPHTALFINNTYSAANGKYGIQFGNYQQYGFAGIYSQLTSTSGATMGDLTFDLKNGVNDTTLTERMRITSNGNVGIGTNAPNRKLTVSGGLAAVNGYNLSEAGTDSLIVNGDFEMNSTDGWSKTAGAWAVVTDAYSGKYALQFTGDSGNFLSDDYIPVDPTKDIMQLEAWVKKSVAGTTPGTLYFGYIAYNSNKSAITTAPCGTYCYFAASGYTIPADGTWHKISATTVGEGTSYPNFPVGTRYIRVLGLMNYAASSNSVTILDHVTVKRLIKGPLIAGENFSTTNKIDRNQYSTLYTTNANHLIIETPASGNVGIGTVTPVAKLGIGGSGRVIDIGGGRIGGMDYTPLNDDEAVPLKYLKNNYTASSTTAASTFWGGSLSSNVYNVNTGNVGIGITNPGDKLTVDGDIRAHSNLYVAGPTDSQRFIHLRYNSVSWPDYSSYIAQTGAANIAGTAGLIINTNIGNYSSNYGINFAIASSSKMFIQHTGNVGIGTTNPSYKLDVQGGDINTSNFVRVGGIAVIAQQSGAIRLGSTNANDLTFNAGNGVGDPRMVIKNDTGNVGIGAIAPVEKLEISGGTTGTRMKINSVTGQDAALVMYENGVIKGSNFWDASDGAWRIATYNISGEDISFQSKRSSTPLDIMFLKGSNGNIGIGTTTPSDIFSFASSTITKININNGYIRGLTIVPVDDTDAASKGYIDDNFAPIGAAGNVFGTGTTNYLPKWTAAHTIANSLIYDNGTNVGIGTAVPYAKLHVYNAVDGIFNGLVVDNRKTYGAGTGVNETSRILLSLSEPSAVDPLNRVMGYIEAGVNSESNSTDGWLALGSRTSANATEKLRITSNGNVGIGTTNPGYKLDVFGGSIRAYHSSDPYLLLLQSSNVAYLENYSGKLHIQARNLPIYFETDSSYTVPKMMIGTNGNVGIGTTTASTKLYVNGGTGNSINVNGGYVMGLNSTPVNADQAVPLGYLQANYAPTSTIAANSFWSGSLTGNVYNANTGNIGIGTTAPYDKLEVAGAIAATGSFGGNNNQGPATLMYYSTTGGYGGIQAVDWGANYKNLILNSFGGNVGIGTTTPNALLNIYSASGNSDIRLNVGANDWRMVHAAVDNTFRLQYNLGNLLTVNTSGNVGVGMTNPRTKAHIWTGEVSGGQQESLRLEGNWVSNPSGPLLRFTNQHDSGTNPNSGEYNLAGIQGVDDTGNWGGSLAFFTTPSGTAGGGNLAERMRITNNGNIGIGTTGPNSKLEVFGGAVNSGNSDIFTINTNSVSTGYYGSLVFRQSPSNIGARITSGNAGSYRGFLAFETSRQAAAGLVTSEAMRIDGAGNVGIGTNSPTSTLQVYGSGDVINVSLRSIGGLDLTPVNNDQAVPLGYLKANYGASTLWGGTTSGDIWSLNSGSVGIGTTSPQAKLHVVGSVRIGEQTRTNWPSDAPIYQTTLYGTAGDIPFRTASTSPMTMNLVYGPFGYANPSCDSSHAKWYRVYAEYVDNITSGGQAPMLRIDFSSGTDRDFTMPLTWGGVPNYRTYLSAPFQETNTNHANIQTWVSGTAGPYVEVRKVELWAYCL